MKGICFIALTFLSAASITTAVPLEVSGETPTTNESAIEVDTSDASNPLSPVMFDGFFPTPSFPDWTKSWPFGGIWGYQH